MRGSDTIRYCRDIGLAYRQAGPRFREDDEIKSVIRQKERMVLCRKRCKRKKDQTKFVSIDPTQFEGLSTMVEMECFFYFDIDRGSQMPLWEDREK